MNDVCLVAGPYDRPNGCWRLVVRRRKGDGCCNGGGGKQEIRAA